MEIAELLKKRRGAAIGTAVGIAWCLVIVLLFRGVPCVRDLCKSINLRIYDWKISLSTPPDPFPHIVHLDIDDNAVKQIGGWPWDRAIHAKIVRRLAELGAKAVVFDIIFGVTGKRKEPRPDLEGLGALDFSAGDLEFFEAVRDAGNVVLATAIGESDYPEPGNWIERLTAQERRRADTLYDEKTWNLTVPSVFRLKAVDKWVSNFVPLIPLIKGCRAVGHIKAERDPDGSHRRMPLLEKYADHCLPSLSLAALQAYWGFSEEDVTLADDCTIRIQHEGKVVTIPVDDEGIMLVNWGKIWESFSPITVMDVLGDKPDPSRAERYKGKIVIVAVTQTGSTDIGVSPRSPETPLSRIHSHCLSTIFTRSFIRSWSPWHSMAIGLLLAIPFSFAAARMRVKVGFTVALAVSVVFLVVATTAFLYGWQDIQLFEFFLVFVPAALVSLAGRAVSIELHAGKASRALERYLSPELLERILDRVSELDLSTKRRELTVLFVDIKGFSTISESVDVDYIAQFLNDFFQRMTQAVFDNRGTIDKFLGDGLLAFFGDPIPLEDHAQAAVKTALDMQTQMTGLNERWTKSGISEFEEGVAIRIGMNTGLMVVGDLGSARRLEYTVIGSAVNVAARLQTLAPAGGIMMTARTKALMHEDIDCQGPETIKVRGIDRKIEVYQIQPDAIATWKARKLNAGVQKNTIQA